MTESIPFRWCFIGTGTLAHVIAKELQNSPYHQIVSVYTRRRESAESFVAEFGGVYYETPEEAINAADVDGVYVVTPHTSHAKYTEIALKAHKPVLCEKPMTVSYSEILNVINIARDENTYLCEAMWTWFSPIANKVKEWVSDGILGDIISAEAIFDGFGNYAPRVTDPNVAGGALLDVGVYSIAYLIKLFGIPDNIICKGKLEGGIDVHESYELTYGEKVFFASSAVDAIEPKVEVNIIGEKGSITVPVFYAASEATLNLNDGTTKTIKADGSYLNEFNIVSQEIRAGLKESKYMPLDFSLAVMKLIQDSRDQLGLKYPFEM